MSQKRITIRVLIVLVIALAGTWSYLNLVKKPIPTEQPQANISSSSQQPAVPEPAKANSSPATWITVFDTHNGVYTNSAYHYQINYPDTEYELRISSDNKALMFINKNFEGDVPDAAIGIANDGDDSTFSSTLSPEENAKRMISSWALSPSGRDDLIGTIARTKFAGKEAATFLYDYTYRIFIDGNNVFVVKTFLQNNPEFQRDYSFINSFTLL